jgi:hypothetical protein
VLPIEVPDNIVAALELVGFDRADIMATSPLSGRVFIPQRN